MLMSTLRTTLELGERAAGTDLMRYIPVGSVKYTLAVHVFTSCDRKGGK